MGLGGSIFQWHPDYEIGFAFVPTWLHALDLCNERGKVYQAEVLRCVEALLAASARADTGQPPARDVRLDRAG
jgi:hypothetical protein